MIKNCKRCGADKAPTEYYKMTGNFDGLTGSCKECIKSNVKKHREENIERIREYDRQRGQLDHRKENVRRVYANRKNDPLKKVQDRRHRVLWLEKNRIKRKCHEIVNNAIRDGIIKRKDCEKCGEKNLFKNIDAHHEDYTKPLEIIWLCKNCHGERHRELNEQKRQKARSK